MYKQGSSDSSAAHSKKSRKSIPTIETVEVHTTYVTESNNEIEKISSPRGKPPPVPLPRKNIKQPAIDNKPYLDSLQTFKKSKEEQNQTTKLRATHDSLSVDLSQSTQSSSRSPMPSTTRQKLFFAESKNDTIVSNTMRDELSISTERDHTLQHTVESSSGEYDSSEKISVKKVRRKSKSKYVTPLKPSSSSPSHVESIISTNTEISTSISVKPKRKSKVKKSADEAKNSNKLKNKNYLYDNLIGIYLHNTSELKFDETLKEPRIKISCCDLETKTFLTKSDAKRSVVTLKEPETLDYIQPVISKGGKFKHFCSLVAEWEELILLNEDFSYIQNDKVMFFFELIDVIPISSKLFNSSSVANQNGWYHIGWAFLKVCPDKKHSHLERRLQLQFYKYQKIPRNKKAPKLNPLPIFDQYLNVKKLIKYPAILELTVKGLKPIDEKLKDKHSGRPQNALELEMSAEIQSIASFCMEPEKVRIENDNILTSTTALWTIKNRWKKLPGQACKCPNRVMQKLIEHKNGSLVSKFNKSGDFLAYTYVTDEKCYNIKVISFPCLQQFIILSGHSNNIYDIDWMNYNNCNSTGIVTTAAAAKIVSNNHNGNNKSFVNNFPIHLVTSSSDRTSIFWTIYNSNQYFYKILPHPSFVYLSKFLYFSNTKSNSIDDIKGGYNGGYSGASIIRIITGGRDGILRIWKYNLNDMDDIKNYDKIFHLENELKYHNHSNSYVTGIICQEKQDTVYSCDSSGEIIEWQLKLKHQQLYGLVARKFQLNTDPITMMQLHPRGRKIFFNSHPIKNQIFIFDIESFQIINSFPENLSTIAATKFTISSCGNYLYQSHQAGDIQIYNLNKSSCNNIVTIKSIFRFGSKNFISFVDFHPKDSFLCYSVYGAYGGVAIYEYDEGNDDAAGGAPSDEKRTNKRDSNKQIQAINYNYINKNKNNLFKNNLIDIIHRIDKVFLNIVTTPPPPPPSPAIKTTKSTTATKTITASATKSNVNNNLIKQNNLINVKFAESKLENVIDKVEENQIGDNYTSKAQRDEDEYDDDDNEDDEVDDIYCGDDNTDNESIHTFTLPIDYEACEISKSAYVYPNTAHTSGNGGAGAGNKTDEDNNQKARKEEIEEINDRTFSVSKSKSIKNQTFSIEKSKVGENENDNDDDDDEDDATSISETLD